MALKETVIRGLRNAIIKGEYKQGERLKETDLCKRYQVSRVPVREALNQLKEEGFIEISPGKGARVTKFSAEDVSNIYDVLIGLESIACRSACQNITDEQIRKLEEYQFLIDKAIESDNGKLFIELNKKFHTLITETSHNPYLIDIREKYRGLIARFSRFAPLIPEQLKATLEEHPSIIEGLKDRNPAMAEFAIREHMNNAKLFIIEYLKKIES